MRPVARLLDAQWLGLPQARQRIFFVGVREDLDRDPAFPKPLPYRYSLREVLPGLVSVAGRTGPGFSRVVSELDAPMNAVLVTDPAQTRYEVVAEVSGASAPDEPVPARRLELAHARARSAPSGRPSPTVLATNGGWSDVAVGRERRRFTIEELKVVCSFPGDFVLTGTYEQQWERLGRAVPPLMMRAVGRALAESVLLPVESAR